MRRSIVSALRFLEQSVNPEGFWSDFLTLAGESVDWVTGYVAYALSSELRLDEVGTTELGLRDIAGRLHERQHLDGGWGYGAIVPSDADSTSWCLLFLSQVDEMDSGSLDAALSFLSKHQNPSDGGFRTYAVPREIGRFMMLDENTSFDGWASSTSCVTASAAQALIKTGCTRGIEEALGYIRRTQTNEGYWNSYWWTDPLYSTVLCMEALTLGAARTNNMEPGDSRLMEKARAWIERTQSASGGWNGEGWPFSTALALRGLMFASPSGSAGSGSPIRRGVDWLLAHQRPDGSWGERHILRIPHPGRKDPWFQAEWASDGRAINATIRDHRRLYTTATAFRALSQYEKQSSSADRQMVGA